jgi:hypothetical protein
MLIYQNAIELLRGQAVIPEVTMLMLVLANLAFAATGFVLRLTILQALGW